MDLLVWAHEDCAHNSSSKMDGNLGLAAKCSLSIYDQQELARAARRYRCVSLLRILERQLPADGNLQLSNLHCLRHVEKDLCVGERIHRNHLNGRVIPGILGSSQDRCKHSASLHFG